MSQFETSIPTSRKQGVSGEEDDLPDPGRLSGSARLSERMIRGLSEQSRWLLAGTHNNRSISSILLVAVCVVWSQVGLGAETPDGHSTSAIRSSGKWLGDRGPADPRPFGNPVFGDGLLGEDYFQSKNRAWVEQGISTFGYVSVNGQWGSEGGPAHGISEALLMMTWEPVRRDNHSGRLVVGIAHDQTFGRPTTREFANNQKLVETPNDLDTDPDLTFTTLGLFHWEHEQRTGPESGWGFRGGQLYAPSYFGSARYLDDDRRFFMARPLAAAAGAQWVGFNDIGLGVNGIVWKGPLYASAAIMDGKANRQFLDVESLVDGQMLYLGEVGFERDFDGPNETALRLTVSHLDVQDGEGPAAGPGQSVIISGDKRFDGRWALAGRWSKSFERLSADYRESASLGLLWLVPFGRLQDLGGLGVFYADPSDAERGHESGFEIFYRLRLTQAIGFMPDVQYWYRDDPDGSRTRSWVWGVRMEFEF